MPITTRSKRAAQLTTEGPSTPTPRKITKRPRTAVASPQDTPAVLRDAAQLVALNTSTISPSQAPEPPSAIISAFRTAECIQAGLQHLLAADPVLAPLILEHGYPADKMLPSGSVTCFEALVKSIIYQQLSGKVAATIHGRVLQLCKEPITPAAVLAAPHEQLRACGLSERKAEYLSLLAAQFTTLQWTDSMLHALPDDELVALLTQVKGIGPWTVHMLAIFNLGRPNVLPVGDLGVRKGMMDLYNLKQLPSPKEMEQVAKKWEPYRSIGSYLMWRVPCNNSPAKPKAVKGRKASAVAAPATGAPSPAAALTTFLP